MSAELPGVRSEPARSIIIAVCLAAVGLGSAWAWLQMRRVMDVGGVCADGGPYVIETPCPEGSGTFLMLGIVLWLAGVFCGLLFAGSTVPVFAGWILLFGSMGGNFLEYTFKGEGIFGDWLFCGILFEVMALPALYLLWRFGLRDAPLRSVALWFAALGAGVWLGLL